MPTGISLHIGVNFVDDKHYWKDDDTPWDGALKGCEADALAMEAIAKKQGFETHKLLSNNEGMEATRDNVKNKIIMAASTLKKGDFFWITYSGHGSQVLDNSGDEFEEDIWDETWCLYDKQLLDDELHELWAKFEKGVRVLILSDSCHSGTVSKVIGAKVPAPPEGIGYRLMPRSALTTTYLKDQGFYDGLQPTTGPPTIEARVLLISGCQDEELSREDQKTDPPGGLFTKSILEALDDAPSFGGFKDYHKFYEYIVNCMPDKKQNPNYLVFGGDDPEFEKSKPLVIG